MKPNKLHYSLALLFSLSCSSSFAMISHQPLSSQQTYTSKEPIELALQEESIDSTLNEQQTYERDEPEDNSPSETQNSYAPPVETQPARTQEVQSNNYNNESRESTFENTDPGNLIYDEEEDNRSSENATEIERHSSVIEDQPDDNESDH